MAAQAPTVDPTYGYAKIYADMDKAANTSILSRMKDFGLKYLWAIIIAIIVIVAVLLMIFKFDVSFWVPIATGILGGGTAAYIAVRA